MVLGAASRTPVGLVQWKTALSRVEAGTSGFLSRGDRDLGVAFQTHLRSQAWYIGEAKNSALLLSPNGYLLSPQSGLKGVRPPVEFEERPRDCSPGHAGKDLSVAHYSFSL